MVGKTCHFPQLHDIGDSQSYQFVSIYSMTTSYIVFDIQFLEGFQLLAGPDRALETSKGGDSILGLLGGV